MEETLFTNVSEEVLQKYRNIGYYYDDYNYINIFRWLWNTQHIHPRIECFPNDPMNKTRVSVRNNMLAKDTTVYVNSYDEAVIWVVNYIINLDEKI